MKLFKMDPDGGSDSGVRGFWLIEIKWLFSIVFLRFSPGSREKFHSHAFHALTIWLWGDVTEERIDQNHAVLGRQSYGSLSHWPKSGRFKWTPRHNVHRVFAHRPTYCLCFRGPWTRTWEEYDPVRNEMITLTHGRNVVSRRPA